MSKLNVQDQDGVTVLYFDGSLTAQDVQQLEPNFKEATQDKGKRVVIDLSKVEMLATPAITMFLTAMNFQRSKGGRVIFTGTEGAIDKLLHICRLDLIMTIVHDPKAAVSQAAR